MCYGQGCGFVDLVHSLYNSTPEHSDDLLARIVMMRRVLDMAPNGSSFLWCAVMFQHTVQVLSEAEQAWGDEDTPTGQDELLAAILDAMYDDETPYDIENSYLAELKCFKRYVTAAFNGWVKHKARVMANYYTGPRIPMQTVKHLIRMCVLLINRCYALEAGFIDDVGDDGDDGGRFWMERAGIFIPDRAIPMQLEA